MIRASLVAQTVKNPPAVQETQVQSLGREDPLEKEMGTHSSILAWRIPWTEESGRLQSMGSQRIRQDWATNTHFQWLWRVLFVYSRVFPEFRGWNPPLGTKTKGLCTSFFRFTVVSSGGWFPSKEKVKREKEKRFSMNFTLFPSGIGGSQQMAA